MRVKNTIWLGLIAITTFGCSDAWLEEKRDVKLVVPSTLEDLQLILRDETNLAKVPLSWAEVSGDDYYFPDSEYPGIYQGVRNAYEWKADIFGSVQVEFDWQGGYYQIFSANVVLETLEKIKATEENNFLKGNIRGAALFLRAQALYGLNQTFGVPYNYTSADTDLGVALDLSASVENVITRSSIRENYEQIIKDLTESIELLPEKPEYFTDPSKMAAYGLLARIYLLMRDYSRADQYANLYLEGNSELLDFNELDAASNVPIQRMNVEVINYSETMQITDANFDAFTRIPNDLYDQYATDDLRKYVFFRDRETGENGTFSFKGSYAGRNRIFTGIATDEMYLIRAECRARAGQVDDAMDDLNTLLITRWRAGTFIPFTAVGEEDALDIILQERRKELIRRGLRWLDLRRLNLESGHEEAIYRMIGGSVYTLPPNSPLYTIPIPNYIIAFNKITQNPR